MIWDTDCWLERGLKRSIQDSFDFGVAKSIVAGIACLLYEENQGSNPPTPLTVTIELSQKKKQKTVLSSFWRLPDSVFYVK